MKQQFLPRERGFLGGQIFKENMVLCPSRVLFLIACFLILVKKNSILKQKRYFEAISNRRDILKQSQRLQFRSACSASLGLRTALPSPSWFAQGPTSSSSAGIVQWIMFTIIKINTPTQKWFAPLRTSIVHSYRNLQTQSNFHPTFSIQGFQACWSNGDHGLQNACTRHCQVSRIQSSSQIINQNLCQVHVNLLYLCHGLLPRILCALPGSAVVILIIEILFEELRRGGRGRGRSPDAKPSRIHPWDLPHVFGCHSHAINLSSSCLWMLALYS